MWWLSLWLLPGNGWCLGAPTPFPKLRPCNLFLQLYRPMFPALISWKEVNISLNNPATITMHSPHNICSIFANVYKNGEGLENALTWIKIWTSYLKSRPPKKKNSDHLKRWTNACPLIAFPKSKYLQILVNWYLELLETPVMTMMTKSHQQDWWPASSKVGSGEAFPSRQIVRWDKRNTAKQY